MQSSTSSKQQYRQGTGLIIDKVCNRKIAPPRALVLSLGGADNRGIPTHRDGGGGDAKGVPEAMAQVTRQN